MRAVILVSLLLMSVAAFAAPSITAPPTADMGTDVEITVSGSTGPMDYLTVVPKGSQQGAYEAWEFAPKPGTYKVKVGSKPGDFEIWLCADGSRAILARRALKVLAITGTISAPTQAAAGAEIEVRWTGPNLQGDYIGVGELDPKGNVALTYTFTRAGNPLKLPVPEKPGEYEIRYLLGQGNAPIGSQRIKVGAVNAAVTAPSQVASGAKFTVQWTGPNNPRDYVTVVKAGAAEKTWDRLEYTSAGNPLTFNAPDAPGDYEVRYLTGQGNATLARARIAVGAVTGSLSGPAQVVAGESFKVSWKGPDNPRNFITIVPKEAREGQYTSSYAHTARDNPVTLNAPLAPGMYELRYSTAEQYLTIARADIKVVPAKLEPGKVQATTTKPMATGGAVQIILDASGSMLQKLGNARRIDVAKQTLIRLTTKTIPAGTPFAFRVFGREVDSCQTDLDVALSPLDPVAVSKRIAALEAKNGAKTPIGASLEKVADDLKGAKGERLVVLVTDGEETCGGDPPAAIAKLREAGIHTRVSIVGFAIDDANLAAMFRRWSDAGGGAFFDAKDAAGLDKALTEAMRPQFEIVNDQGQVIASGIVGGDAVDAPAGNYSVRIKGKPETKQPVVVKPKGTTSVQF